MIYDDDQNNPVKKVFTESKRPEVFVIPFKDSIGRTLTGIKENSKDGGLFFISTKVSQSDLNFFSISLGGFFNDGTVIKPKTYSKIAIEGGRYSPVINNEYLQILIKNRKKSLRLQFSFDDNNKSVSVIYDASTFIVK